MIHKIKTHPRRIEVDAIERMAAADLVLKARRVTIDRQKLTVADRKLYAERFRALALELDNAAGAMLHDLPDEEFIPEYLRPDAAARIHK